MKQIEIIPIQHGIPCQPGNATAFRLDVFGMYVGNFSTESEAQETADNLVAGVFPSNFSREFIDLFLNNKKVWQDQETERLADIRSDADWEELLWNSSTGAPE